MSSTLLLFIRCTKINGQVFNVEYVMTVVTHSHPKDHIAYAEFNSLFGQGKTINKRHNIYILMHTHCCLHKVLDSIAHSSFQYILFMSLRHLDVFKVLSQLIKIEKIFARIKILSGIQMVQKQMLCLQIIFYKTYLFSIFLSRT